MVGPAFEYKDWDNFINLREEYAKMRRFSNYKRAFVRFLSALMCLGLGIVLNGYFDVFYMVKDEFREHSFLYKMYYMILVVW